MPVFGSATSSPLWKQYVERSYYLARPYELLIESGTNHFEEPQEGPVQANEEGPLPHLKRFVLKQVFSHFSEYGTNPRNIKSLAKRLLKVLAGRRAGLKSDLRRIETELTSVIDDLETSTLLKLVLSEKFKRLQAKQLDILRELKDTISKLESTASMIEITGEILKFPELFRFTHSTPQEVAEALGLGDEDDILKLTGADVIDIMNAMERCGTTFNPSFPPFDYKLHFDFELFEETNANDLRATLAQILQIPMEEDDDEENKKLDARILKLFHDDHAQACKRKVDEASGSSSEDETSEDETSEDEAAPDSKRQRRA